MPFPFRFSGVNYGDNSNGGIFVGSNGYITFGGGSWSFSNLGAFSPAFRCASRPSLAPRGTLARRACSRGAGTLPPLPA